jgi:hypothetical protein
MVLPVMVVLAASPVIQVTQAILAIPEMVVLAVVLVIQVVQETQESVAMGAI